MPGEQISLARSDSCWDARLPYLDEVQILTLPEDTTQLAALTSGNIEVLWQVGQTSLGGLQNNPDIQVLESLLGDYGVVVMRPGMEPFNDIRVRQALNICR